MRLFFDANVLLDGYCQRQGAGASEQCILLCDGGKFEGWVAWHTLSNAFYLVRGHSKSSATALQFISDLLSWADVAMTDKSSATAAVLSGMADFEDALQVAAAVACGADVILTRNLSDFRSSPVLAMTPESFLAAHALPVATA
jgi:predicted nucleic acid-binding protein